MAYTFDSLGYARRLREGGIPLDQAEAHADAARDFIMSEIATRQDLSDLEKRFQLALDVQSLRLLLQLGGLGAALAAGVVTILKLII